MDVLSLARSARHGWWIITLTAVVAAGGAVLVSLASPARYATTETFFVTTPSNGVVDAYQGGLFSQQRMQSYAALLSGDRVARAVANDASIGLNPRQVQQRITATVVPNTVLLTATVTDTDRSRSLRVAAAAGKSFGTLVETLETPLGGRASTVKVEVVAGPTPNPAPVSPRPVRNGALGFLAGLVAGLGLARLRDVKDSSVVDTAQLTASTGAPVLASIPFDGNARSRPLAAGVHRSVRAEAFRHLRTNVHFVDVDRPVSIVTVTSAVPEEGKSTTAVNLAIAFAEADSRVLLVEADLRRPQISAYLDLEGAVGLSDVLARRAAFEDVVQVWGPHSLSVLLSGSVPPNPSELLGSAAMTTLLTGWRERFDIVIIDTPPLLPVTDAAVVAAKTDGAIMVTRYGRTPRTQVSRGVADLRAVGARVLGCVLNMEPPHRSRGEYPYRYPDLVAPSEAEAGADLPDLDRRTGPPTTRSAPEQVTSPR